MDSLGKKRLKSGLAVLALSFGLAASAGAPAAEAATTYWKTQTIDAVISLKPCEGSGACGEVYWVNPADKKLFDYFGDKSAREAGQPVTEADVKALCGFSPKLSFHEVAEKHWKGTMELRGMGFTVNVDAVRQSDREMRVDTSKLFFRQSETWTRIDANDPRYPKCEKPAP